MSTVTDSEVQEHTFVLADVPAFVERVHIDGVTRTKHDFLAKIVKNCFTATNFEEVVQNAQKSRRVLEQLGLFKKVDVLIDISRGQKSKGKGYEITYRVKEHRRVVGHIGTMIGNNDGSLNINAATPNALGRAETVSANMSYGTKNAVGLGLNFTKPLFGSPELMFQTGVFQQSSDVPWSSCTELNRGIAAEISFPYLRGVNSVRWEGVWREMSWLNAGTPMAIRKHCGPSLKSSLKHVWTYDSRPNRVMPNQGLLVKITNEAAGLGGDTHFWKVQAETQISRLVPLDTIVQLTASAGFAQPLASSRSVGLRLQDKFMLGGPLNLRGFVMNGAGDQADGNALGGNVYWLSGLHIYTPLPFRPGKGGFGDLFRTHLFVTAGNLQNIVPGSSHARDQLMSLVQTARVSYGLGIVMVLGGMARLELNYCWPYKYQTGDRINPGFQFGVGMTFQ